LSRHFLHFAAAAATTIKVIIKEQEEIETIKSWKYKEENIITCLPAYLLTLCHFGF